MGHDLPHGSTGVCYLPRPLGAGLREGCSGPRLGLRKAGSDSCCFLPGLFPSLSLWLPICGWILILALHRQRCSSVESRKKTHRRVKICKDSTEKKGRNGMESGDPVSVPKSLPGCLGVVGGSHVAPEAARGPMGGCTYSKAGRWEGASGKGSPAPNCVSRGWVAMFPLILVPPPPSQVLC